MECLRYYTRLVVYIVDGLILALMDYVYTELASNDDNSTAFASGVPGGFGAAIMCYRAAASIGTKYEYLYIPSTYRVLLPTVVVYIIRTAE